MRLLLTFEYCRSQGIQVQVREQFVQLWLFLVVFLLLEKKAPSGNLFIIITVVMASFALS